MQEIKKLGIRGTGQIDKRYGTETTASYSLFECPVCKQHFELKTIRGNKQKTCKECRGTQNTTHGKSNTLEYFVWQSMLQRCNNPKNKKYHIYGGKGVQVCPAWNTFEGFWKDMGSTYKEGLIIDRLDSNKNYCSENCQWVSLSYNSHKTTKRRPVMQYRVVLKPEKNVVFIQEFESAKHAADVLGLTAAHITAVCQGKRKTHGGFAWSYK